VPEIVTCTGCGSKLKVAAMPPPGKKLRCPNCQAVFAPQPVAAAAPAPAPAVAEPLFEEVAERPVAKTRPRDEPQEEQLVFTSSSREEEEEKVPVKSFRKKRPAESDEEEEPKPRKKGAPPKGDFEFDGEAGDFFKVLLVCVLLTMVTLGAAGAWTTCMMTRWQVEHTLIKGRRLRFVGTGFDFLILEIITFFLICITLGIYTFWAVPKITRWFIENIEYADAEDEE
jgi:hypothetical protein